MTWLWVTLIVVLLLVIAWYLSSTAGRLDRLHRRVDAGHVSLDRSLLRRSSVVSELASTQEPNPEAAAKLATAAHDARRVADADDVTRGLAESALSHLLAAEFESPETVARTAAELGNTELTDELASTCRRVEMSRRFLNDAVRACTDVRDQWLVRRLGLAGHTAMPEPFEMDDTPPVGFGVR